MVLINYSKGEIQANLADTWREKAMGLRGKHTGSMLFKMEEPSRPVIDMVMVPQRLQIIFISEKLQVQEIIHADPGFNFYKPEEKCKYFLETFSFTNIEEGETLRMKNF